MEDLFGGPKQMDGSLSDSMTLDLLTRLSGQAYSCKTKVFRLESHHSSTWFLNSRYLSPPKLTFFFHDPFTKMTASVT